MSRRLRPRERIAVVAALTVVTLGLAAAPRPFSAPFAKLANYDSDGPDPIWNSPRVDGEALERGGEIVPDSSDETYYIDATRDAQLGHDLIGASLLYFLPARPVPTRREARWILLYDVGPPRVRAAHELGPDIYLVRNS